jgi:hypothetical protein
MVQFRWHDQHQMLVEDLHMVAFNPNDPSIMAYNARRREETRKKFLYMESQRHWPEEKKRPACAGSPTDSAKK